MSDFPIAVSISMGSMLVCQMYELNLTQASETLKIWPTGVKITFSNRGLFHFKACLGLF